MAGPSYSTAWQQGMGMYSQGVLNVNGDILTALEDKRAPMVALPPCADVLLSLQNTTDFPPASHHITEAFQDYFAFGRGTFLDLEPNEQALVFDRLDLNLRNCLGIAAAGDVIDGFPPHECMSHPCATLHGRRDPATAGHEFGRVFVGDLVFLFYFERMGIFLILNRILSEFSTRGGFPLPNGAFVAGTSAGDALLSVVLEAMVRETKSGMSSTLRDREGSYRRVLGWTSQAGQQLQTEAIPNMAFSLFHKFVQSSLRYFKDKRVADAIQGVAQSVSASALAEISDTVRLLKQAFRPFDYGRTHTVTVTGLLWLVAGLSVIREAKAQIGVPPGYNEPAEYIPAAYDILVARRPVTPAKLNRYLLHRNCARYARRLLLDIDGLNPDLANFATQGGFLNQWLFGVEDDVEGYRNSYRSLTGIDLAEPGPPSTAQQVLAVRG